MTTEALSPPGSIDWTEHFARAQANELDYPNVRLLSTLTEVRGLQWVDELAASEESPYVIVLIGGADRGTLNRIVMYLSRSWCVQRVQQRLNACSLDPVGAFVVYPNERYTRLIFPLGTAAGSYAVHHLMTRPASRWKAWIAKAISTLSQSPPSVDTVAVVSVRR